MSNRKRTVSLVLGSGGARGLAHIGVIQVLEEQGLYHRVHLRVLRGRKLLPVSVEKSDSKHLWRGETALIVSTPLEKINRVWIVYRPDYHGFPCSGR